MVCFDAVACRLCLKQHVIDVFQQIFMFNIFRNQFSGRILVHVPFNRPTIDDILNSQWMQDTPTKTNSKARPTTATMASSKTQSKKPSCFSRNRKKYKAETSKHTTVDMSLIQIHFNTKRSNSVLEPNFLHPIDNVDGATEKEVIVTCTQTKSFLSATFKKRIGPMEPKTKGKSLATSTGDNNNKKTRMTNETTDEPNTKVENSCTDVDGIANGAVVGSLKSNINATIEQQSEEDEQQGEYLMAPTCTNSLTNLNPLEMEARMTLMKLGVSSEMLCQAIENGPRSDIIGAYRIIVHRLQKQQMYAKRADESNVTDDQPVIPKNNHRICAIL